MVNNNNVYLTIEEVERIKSSALSVFVKHFYVEQRVELAKQLVCISDGAVHALTDVFLDNGIAMLQDVFEASSVWAKLLDAHPETKDTYLYDLKQLSASWYLTAFPTHGHYQAWVNNLINAYALLKTDVDGNDVRHYDSERNGKRSDSEDVTAIDKVFYDRIGTKDAIANMFANNAWLVYLATLELVYDVTKYSPAVAKEKEPVKEAPKEPERTAKNLAIMKE